MSFRDGHGWSKVGILQGVGPVIDTSASPERYEVQEVE